MENEFIRYLFVHKKQFLYNYLRKMGCSHEDTEDIIQDTFYKALIYIEGIDEKSISPWLFKVATNKYFDICRKRKKHPDIQVELVEFLEHLNTDSEPGEIVISAEKNSDIVKTLEVLKPVHKDLLIFKYEMELSYKEISEHLGLSENNVRTYLYRARNEFKNKWKEFSYGL